MATAPLLDLKTIAPQHSILIDGTSYFLRHDEALSLRQSQIVERAFPRVMELAAISAQRELTEDEERELASLLQQAAPVVLDAPAEVHARLTELQRFNVFVAFFPLLRSKLPTPIGAVAPAASNTTGANGSLDFKPTTAARQKAGSRRSRKR